MGYPKTGARARGNAGAQSERIDRLLGQRGTDTSGAAVTFEDAAALGSIALQSAIVSAAPTAAEHNALVADVRALAAILNTMGAKLTGL